VKADGDEDCEFYPPDVPALSPDTPRPGWFMFPVNDEMMNGVQVTIDTVDELKASYYKPELFAERFLDMTWLDPRFGGTADVTLAEPFGWVHLVDHKNGYMLVDHRDNEQLLNYAVGLVHEHPDCEGVRVTISQPNAPHAEGAVRTVEYTRDEIDVFREKMVAAAKATDRPNAPLRAGDWCTWCAAKTRCPELDDLMKQEALTEFDDDPDVEKLPVPTKVEELARKARWVPLINAWCNEIMANLQREIECGNVAPGWKLVRGRAHRKWSDSFTPQMIAQRFVAVGVPEAQLWHAPELKSPAQIEKLGGAKLVKAVVKSTVKELQYQPEGKVTVVEDSDPREAVAACPSAHAEFDLDDFE
jgi:hypothetical protein